MMKAITRYLLTAAITAAPVGMLYAQSTPGAGAQTAGQAGAQAGGAGAQAGGQAGAQGNIQPGAQSPAQQGGSLIQPNGTGTGIAPNARGNANANANMNANNALMFGQSPWFGNAAVQQNLGLSTDQLGRLTNNYQQLWNRYQQEMSQLPNNLSADQLSQRRQQLNQSFQRDFGNSINDVFTDANQRSRFNQLGTQYLGLGALDDPTIQQRFNLTTEQRAQIARMQQDWRNQLSQLNAAAANVQGREFNWNDYYTRYNRSIEDIFTPDQLRTWRELRGENFAFPETVFRSQYYSNISNGTNSVTPRGASSRPSTGGTAR